MNFTLFPKSLILIIMLQNIQLSTIILNAVRKTYTIFYINYAICTSISLAQSKFLLRVNMRAN